MLKISRMIVGIIVFFWAIFIMAAQRFETMPYMMFGLGLFMMLTCLEELHKKPTKFWGYISIAVSIFIIDVSLESLITG